MKENMSPAKAKNLERLERCLAKNRPMTKLNLFNRK